LALVSSADGERVERGVSSPPGTRLRFGLLCDSTILETWHAQILHALLALDGVQLSLVVLNAAPDLPRKWAKPHQLRPRTFLYRAYRDFLFRPQANQPRDLAWLLTRVPALRCKATKVGQYSQYFQEHDVSTIRSYGLDFMMRFGFNIIRGDILQAARFGIWSFHHDDEQKYRGGPPCFWEIYNGDPLTGVILQRLTTKLDAGVVLRKGYFPTDFSSYQKSYDRAVLGSVGWPAAVCTDILNGSAEYVDGDPSDTRAPIYHDPHNREMIRFLCRTTSSALSGVWTRLQHLD
jgi:hypothetical protein